MIKVKVKQGDSYKVGLNEVVGLKAAMQAVMQPMLDHLNATESWSGDDWFKFDELEYKSRAGFIPYSSNCGGIEIASVIPKCGEHDFPQCEFAEYEPRAKGMTDAEYDLQRDNEEQNGAMDSYLRVILKFEGIDSNTGEMSFYLNVCTCGDAPYFQIKNSVDLYESEFKVRTLAQLKTVGKKHVANAIKEIG